MTVRQKRRRERRISALLQRSEGALLPREPAEKAAHLDWPAARAELDLAMNEATEAGDSVELVAERIERLDRAARSPEGDALRRSYVERFGAVGVRRFRAGSETQVFMLPVETFPGHINNIYVVADPAHTLLFDVGSGAESSRRDLDLGFSVIRSLFGEPRARWDGFDTLVVSHAHIDHYGGLNAARRETSAPVAVHELDARVLACFDERIVVASKDLDVFLRRAGVREERRKTLTAMYGASKDYFRPVEPERVLRDGDLLGSGYRVHHVPGHCPGLICLQVHDVLLTSDHVLARITPHQFPQAITAFGGLEHYFHSLSKIRKLEGINLALGGHEEPILDLRHRCDEIALFHRDRLAKVMVLCEEPKTILDVSQAMFGEQTGYGPLLALEEAGAHVEYLYQLGRLRIDNLEEVSVAADPVIRYVARA
jgi:glyoxylase-like metal-dependent hydrolase (beta-lactamase superfamily II)